jgi:hypothetical protein
METLANALARTQMTTENTPTMNERKTPPFHGVET